MTAMGAVTEEPAPVDDLWVVRAGDAVHVGGRAEVHTEDGKVVPVDGVATNLPLGYHWLHRRKGAPVRLIVSPARCHLPPALHTWGWAVQLYAARSTRSWGMGDLADLRALATWSAGQGARMMLLSPLHAPTPVPPVQASPYYPSSRCFRSPLHIAVDEVAGASGLASVAEAHAQARALNGRAEIDRDEVLRLKLAALDAIWQAGAASAAALGRYRDERGDALKQWARFCTLAEVHGPTWRSWPAELQDAHSPAVGAACDPDRVRFHEWLQLVIEDQLAAAGSGIDLMQDLAVGVDPGGADAWLWREVFAEGVSVGAPPDQYNAQGQDWGLPPFDPWKLRRAHFAPFIETVRAGFRHAGGLRVDHVMGLFRLFWIPEGGSPADGTYVRYPWDELLDIVALESQRAGAYVVGEDLGTVEPWVRDALAERNVLSYRLLWFEPEPPRSFPTRSLGAVTTHDLPTVAGVWTGADLDAQERRGMAPSADAADALRRRISAWTGLADHASVDDAVVETYRLLGTAPSALVTASLDDVLGVEVRPNYPGTVGGTNWVTALPVTLEEAFDDERLATVADVLNSR